MGMQLTHNVLDAIKPDNMNMALVTKSFDIETATNHEPYYNFSYRDTPIEKALITDLLHASNPKLVPPPDLKYAPYKLDLITEGAGEEGPEMLLKKGRVESWWLGMGHVHLPKAIIQIKIGYSQKMLYQIENKVFASIHSRLVHSVL